MFDFAKLSLLFAQEAPSTAQQPFQFAPMIVIGVLAYLLLIKPERTKRADMQKLLDGLAKNTRVVTIGGIHGTIVNIQKDSDEVTLKVDEATNTKIRVARSAISKVVTGTSSANNE